MEIEGEDGTKLSLKPGVISVFGRGSGFNTDDITVSRRHVSLQLKPSAAAGEELSDRVSFEILGRNPIWTRSGEKFRTFRRSEKGEISEGDRFCVSSRIPVWFNLKKRDGDTVERASDSEIGLFSIDYSEIDRTKEFGFLVIGKEFDQYPKSRVRDIKQWEWFLEDSTKRNSDDEDDDEKEMKKGLSGKRRRRRKKGNEEDDDDDWSVESEEDKELLVKSKRVLNPIYSTRSKKTKKDINSSSSSAHTKQRGRVDIEEDEDDDDDDETLGGFIVSDEEDKLEEDDDDDEEVDLDDDDEDEDED